MIRTVLWEYVPAFVESMLRRKRENCFMKVHWFSHEQVMDVWMRVKSHSDGSNWHRCEHGDGYSHASDLMLMWDCTVHENWLLGCKWRISEMIKSGFRCRWSMASWVWVESFSSYIKSILARAINEYLNESERIVQKIVSFNPIWLRDGYANTNESMAQMKENWFRCEQRKYTRMQDLLG